MYPQKLKKSVMSVFVVAAVALIIPITAIANPFSWSATPTRFGNIWRTPTTPACARRCMDGLSV
jgi:hypothetical protein